MVDSVFSQTGRIYRLTVGDPTSGKGFEIHNLTIAFEVIKASDNSKKNSNSATIEIYNLSRDNQNFLEKPYIKAHLEVGYFSTGLKSLYKGEVVLASTKNADDGSSVTELRFEGSYKDLTFSTLSKSIAPHKTCRDAIEEVARAIPNVSKNVLNGNAINSRLIYGYPLHSSARNSLDELAKCYNFEWQIDGDTLYVNDVNGSHTRNTKNVYVLNESSGLLGRPFPVLTKDKSNKDKSNSKQFQVKILLNPELVAGSTIKVEYENINGLFKVDEIRHSGSNNSDEWFSEIICSLLE